MYVSCITQNQNSIITLLFDPITKCMEKFIIMITITMLCKLLAWFYSHKLFITFLVFSMLCLCSTFFLIIIQCHTACTILKHCSVYYNNRGSLIYVNHLSLVNKLGYYVCHSFPWYYDSISYDVTLLS